MAHENPRSVNPSHWALTADATEYPPLEDDTAADVAVVGGGITGLTTALYLKRAGRRVIVLEAGNVGMETTGHSTAKLTALHALTYASLEETVGAEGARIYAEANRWGLWEISGIVRELEIDCGLVRRPALTYTTDPERAEAIEEEVLAARRAGLPVELVDDADLPYPIESGVLLPDQATFHPLRYCQGLARELGRDGAIVHEATRVVDVDEDGDPLRLRTAQGATVEAEWAILACGLPFLDRGGFFARTHPSRSYCVTLEARGDLPETMSINSGQPTRSILPIEPPGGQPLLLVAGEEHKVGQAGDTPGRYERLEEFARRHFEVGRTTARWSAQDYIPVDGIPLVGGMPLGSERTLVATGFRKWGLTTGTLAARILADHVGGTTNPWARLFDARRSQLAGVGEAIKENANVLKRFVGDRIRQPQQGSPEELAPGTGGVCRHHGESVAAFREEDGTLRLLSPTCTHMGCRVTWNPAERSWDCPCHGSRFDVRGQVITGPAVTPLAPVDPS